MKKRLMAEYDFEETDSSKLNKKLTENRAKRIKNILKP